MIFFSFSNSKQLKGGEEAVKNHQQGGAGGGGGQYQQGNFDFEEMFGSFFGGGGGFGGGGRRAGGRRGGRRQQQEQYEYADYGDDGFGGGFGGGYSEVSWKDSEVLSIDDADKIQDFENRRVLYSILFYSSSAMDESEAVRIKNIVNRILCFFFFWIFFLILFRKSGKLLERKSTPWHKSLLWTVTRKGASAASMVQGSSRLSRCSHLTRRRDQS